VRERAGHGNGRTGCAREEQRGREMGRWASQAENREENEIPFSFSFSNISKHFKMILDPILNLNQTTPTKNSNATA
jgi:hypothetical protein